MNNVRQKCRLSDGYYDVYEGLWVCNINFKRDEVMEGIAKAQFVIRLSLSSLWGLIMGLYYLLINGLFRRS